ncbi:cytoskeleton protein RodZ [Duganella sacchari]|uniref:Cytoskeleton protein RodZ n=1 Tax=Duganella sacchari TaxID=551987 RepID=A0A1M7HYI8_9BURK|nr:RodZ domain-containing protein [Duganella sacchari]SHM33621.1 cytoskeleton protein RodZ [Duganella sacchari]
MNSEWAEPPQEQGNTGKATPGALLAAQREAMGWTVEQIADQLKLAVRQVKALESGDYAALPNSAVTRGFVRAYAKVLKMDAAPLVAMIEAAQPTSPEVVVAPRKDLAQSFSESRFPSMTGRSSGPAGWLVGLAAVVVVGGAAAYAYQSGMIPASLFERKEEEAKPAEATTAPIDTTLVKPGQETTVLQTQNVPLISVPPQGSEQAATPAAAEAAPVAAAPAPTPVPAAVAPAPVAAAPAPAPAPAPAAPAVAGAGHQLVLKVNEDSWVEIRRPGTTSLISRVVKAGSTETFDIKDPALLIVGKPGGVEATLSGAPLSLPLIPGGTISRVNIK